VVANTEVEKNRLPMTAIAIIAIALTVMTLADALSAGNTLATNRAFFIIVNVSAENQIGT
jgi:hypothetical protein